jgi:shikimate kinase
MEQNIILIGFMGVGKTSLGKKLANMLNYQFIDTDHLIEEREKKSIRDIFALHGEEYFRKLEAEVVDQLPKTNSVIATGGGLPCYQNNMHKLNAIGYTVYLHRPVKELASRLRQGRIKRPLIAELNDEELLIFINKNLGLREVFYRQSQFIADRNEQSPNKLLKLIEDKG